MTTIYLASDHAGLTLKKALVEHLKKQGHNCHDLGTNSPDSCDYPVFAHALCEKVLANEGSFGVLVCGSGVGMSMAANRHKGIRAALCSSEFQAKATRQHNDANVLCLGERTTGSSVALAIADAFFETSFEAGRHQQRIDMF